MKKIALRENRSANALPQCIADTAVRRRDGSCRLSDHDECMARVGQQSLAPLGRTSLSAHRWRFRSATAGRTEAPCRTIWPKNYREVVYCISIGDETPASVYNRVGERAGECLSRVLFPNRHKTGHHGDVINNRREQTRDWPILNCFRFCRKPAARMCTLLGRGVAVGLDGEPLTGSTAESQ